jgi:hypothetical protein
MIWHIQTDYTALLMSSIHLQFPCWLFFLTSPLNYFAYGYFTGARAYSGPAESYSDTSVNVCWTLICHIPDDSILHTSNPYLYNIRFVKHVFQLLSAFAKLRKATISFVMSVRLFVRPSVRPHGWITMKFDVWVFFENLSRKFTFHHNLTRITGTLHEELCTFMVISRSVILRMGKVSDK